MGIPLELLTLLVSTVVSGLMSMKKAKDEAYINALAQNQRGWKEAREVTNKGFQITRRWIALMTVFSVIVLPKLVAIFIPEVLVTVGYSEIQSGFLFFTSDVERIKWVTATGLTITPLDSHMVSAIVGMYFGSKVGK